jgi:hypothetical protein
MLYRYLLLNKRNNEHSWYYKRRIKRSDIHKYR